MPRILLYTLLAFLAVLSMGWRFAPGDGDGPAGCQAMFAATSRGGATSVGGGGEDRGIRVTRVIDGDTIEVSGRQRVRYIGIDTPEVGGIPEYYGPEAKSFNRNLAGGRKVRLEKDESERDRFGRLLRFVYADGILVNAELVREGYARAVAYPPDIWHAACFAALEQEAREAGRGMWARGEALSSPCLPAKGGPLCTP